VIHRPIEFLSKHKHLRSSQFTASGQNPIGSPPYRLWPMFGSEVGTKREIPRIFASPPLRTRGFGWALLQPKIGSSYISVRLAAGCPGFRLSNTSWMIAPHRPPPSGNSNNLCPPLVDVEGSLGMRVSIGNASCHPVEAKTVRGNSVYRQC
jgi:hypothetical protein